ncbi:restriction endonuclease subunit S [Vibrio lentus]|uniref:Restriction endonuclease subunit S n=1 Tax=Vibrio lentus TaxID=136468 RepID=A0A4U2F141_9VIBR|nr:restriction endonuclease subunit S [Vibrio lentus]TKG07898.1 restriction endonuclease subunit S [Vibrio lentus]
MGKYTAYQVYEDAHNDFVSELPQGWVLSKFKYEVDYVEGPGILANDFHEAGVPLLRIQNVKDRFTSGEIKTYLEPHKVKDKWEHFKTKTGDLLISGSASTDLVTEVTEQYEGAVPYTGLIRLRAKKDRTDKNYVRYFVQSELFKNQIDNLKTGSTIQHFGPIHLQQVVYPSASVAEQTQIANFLDHETAKIDTLVDKQQQLIKLLKEKRQAVISHAVTKGLNPDAPMKDSGVEWLGEVPERWVVSKIKNYAKIESGHTPSKTKAEYWVDCTIPWVSLNDSRQLKVVDYINETAYQISELGMANSSAHLLPERAVVFTRDASIGLSAITTRPMAVSQHLIAWLCNEDYLIPEYLLLVFYAMESEFNRYTFGATLKTIGMDNVRSLTAAFPSTEEQGKIARWAFRNVETIKDSIEKAEEVIALIRERRTALISAAVTGKIDVRNWQAPVNQEVLQQEAS